MFIFDATNYASISITDDRGIDSAVDLLNAGELDYVEEAGGYRVDSVPRFVAAVEANDFDLDLDGLDVDIEAGEYVPGYVSEVESRSGDIFSEFRDTYSAAAEYLFAQSSKKDHVAGYVRRCFISKDERGHSFDPRPSYSGDYLVSMTDPRFIALGNADNFLLTPDQAEESGELRRHSAIVLIDEMGDELGRGDLWEATPSDHPWAGYAWTEPHRGRIVLDHIDQEAASRAIRARDYNGDEAAEVAARIRRSDVWVLEDSARLCDLAGLSEQWQDADPEEAEPLIYLAADYLGVEIF